MERKDAWEKLINMPDEQEVNPALAQRAIEQFEKEQSQPKKSWFSTHWKYIAASAAACAVFVSVFIPVYNALNKPQVDLPSDSVTESSANGESSYYYETSEITMNEIGNPAAFLLEQQKDVYYYTDSGVKTKAAILNENGAFAFLSQEVTYSDENGFDVLHLWCAVLANAEFEFMESFEATGLEFSCNDIEIIYGVKEKGSVSGKVVRAKFDIEDTKYYLEIETSGTADAEAKITHYVNALLNKA